MKHLTGYILITAHPHVFTNGKNARVRLPLQILRIPTIMSPLGHRPLRTTTHHSY